MVSVLVTLAVGGCAGGVPTAGSAATPISPGTLGSSASPTSSGSQILTLLPDGAWHVDLSSDDLVRAGAKAGALPVGSYTWTFAGSRARLSIGHDGRVDICSAEASQAPGGVSLHFLENLGCGGWTDTIRWAVDAQGLHLKLVDSTARREENAPYLEAKPWRPVDAEPIPSWPAWSVRCEPGCHGPMASGTFVSSGFMPGMSLRFAGSEEWFNTRDDQDEIEFDLNESALRFWRNPRPAGPSGEPIAGVEDSEAALTTWFVRNDDMVVSAAEHVALGGGVTATTFATAVSESNVNDDPGCPQGIRSCLNVLWINDGHVFGIGYGSAQRFFVFTLANGDAIVVSVDAPNRSTLEEIEPVVERLLATLSVPGGN